MFQSAWNRLGSVMQRFLNLLGLAAIVFLSASACPAQNLPPGAQGDVGIQPYESYDRGTEDINLANGNLNIFIPLVHLSGRNRHDFDVSISYNSQIWGLATSTGSGSNILFWGFAEAPYESLSDGKSPVVGWAFGFPSVSASTVDNGTVTYTGNFSYEDARGATHLFPNIATNCSDDQTGAPAPCPYPGSGPTEDATFMELSTGSLLDYWVTQKDGEQIVFDNPSSSVAPSRIIDANGNLITFSNSFPTMNITDTLKRTISVGYYPSASNVSAVQYKDSGGVTRTITFNYTAFVLKTSFTNPSTADQFCNSSGSGCSVRVLSSIVLPNGLTYTFQYDSYGELVKITYPAGGYTRYDYGTFQHADYAPDYNAADIREVVAKHVCPAAVTPLGATTSAAGNTCSVAEQTTSYSPTISVNTPFNSSEAVTDPLGNLTAYDFATNFSCTNPVTGESTFCPPRELEHKVYEGTASLMRTIQTCYSTNSNCQPTDTFALPISVTTTLNDSNQVSQVQRDYTGQADDIAEERDYDYGSGTRGPLIRKTDFTWLKVNPVNGKDYTAPTLYILDRKASESVFDASGTLKAKTTYEYDNYTAGLSPSGAVQHFSNFSTSYTTRGNLTATERWRNTDGAMLTTRSQYDDAGNLVSVTDPNNNPTRFSYADSWANASCAPAGGSADAYVTQITNALGQISKRTYNSCTGTIATSTDRNGQTTSLAYDLMDRRNQTAYPDGGQTTVCFSELLGSTCQSSSQPIKIVTTSKMNSSTNTVWTEVLDGLGRLTEKQLNSDSQVDKTDTSYDGLGRIATVSNPYRSTTDPTYGITTYTYDALDRTTQVAHPDGTKVISSYAGRATKVSDEGNGTKSVQRILQTDGLGRMVSVCEVSSVTQLGSSGTPAACGQDIAATGFLTTYQYDALGNLLQVNQGSLGARTFTYNSLSELTSATNPESGTTTYTYDADGNVASRTQPEPNQTDPNVTVTTSYTYDALNRRTANHYSDATMDTDYNYDETSPWGFTLTNQIGRLTTEYDGNTGKVFSYDPMGRVARNDQCTPQNCGTDDFFIAYSYDLAGDLLTSTDGEGNMYTRVYNNAGELSSLASSYVDANHPGTLLSETGYDAPGQLTIALLGNGVTETRGYNSRLRMTSETAGSVYSLALGYAANGDVTSANDSVNGNWTYTYDDFNRLATASGPSQPYAYGYDRFGNRWNQKLNGSCTSGSSVCLTFDANNHINNGIETYDAAGNLMTDGFHNYFYDAEHHLVQVDGSEGYCESGTGTMATACYTYDAEGQRMRRTVPGSGITDDYLYDLSGHMITQVSGGGFWIRTEIYAGARHVATYENDLDTPTTFFTHGDQVGTERVETGVSGTSCETITSLPFGDGMNEAGSCDPSALRFTGKERDWESNLDNFGARYNSSNLGRFMSPDPTRLGQFFDDPQTWNMYTYAHNSPLEYVDRNGKWPTRIHNEIIDAAFPNLTAEQRNILKEVSAQQDSFLGGGQGNSLAFQHAMRGPGESVKDAATKFNAFVSFNEKQAMDRQVAFWLAGNTGYSDKALAEFAAALHAVVDSTSPTHAGFQLWNWHNPALDRRHVQGESTINLQQFQHAVAVARQAFLNTFRPFDPFDFLQMGMQQPQEKVTVTIEGDNIIDCTKTAHAPACTD